MPKSGLWYWDDGSHRYRDAETGRYISFRQIVELRDTYIERSMGGVNNLASRISTGDINVQQWVLEMRTAIKDAYISEYMLARGGIDAMTQSDWGRLGQMIRGQYGYLQNFATDIQNGKLSVEQVAMRARMYMDSATQAYEKANAISHGLPGLPAYPGDGQTVCRANCKCEWRYEETETEWLCFWDLGDAEHCPDCESNASRWNPLVIPKV